MSNEEDVHPEDKKLTAAEIAMRCEELQRELTQRYTLDPKQWHGQGRATVSEEVQHFLWMADAIRRNSNTAFAGPQLFFLELGINALNARHS